MIRRRCRPSALISALGVWPLLMGVSMWLQMKMNPEPTDEIQKMMFAWMPVMFTFTMGSFASGLVIYWTWNNLLSVAQQWVIMKPRRREVRALGQSAEDVPEGVMCFSSRYSADGGRKPRPIADCRPPIAES